MVRLPIDAAPFASAAMSNISCEPASLAAGVPENVRVVTSNASHSGNGSPSEVGIEAPEKGQPFGRASRESLASMVAGRNVTVERHKRDRYGRLVGKVFADNHDVGLVQVERGTAWHYKAYQREQRAEDAQAYAQAEVQAKAARRSLWSDPAPMPPWEWRRARRGN